MSENELAGATALVTGASRGFGRGIATALSRAGAGRLGRPRSRPLEELRAELGGSFTAVSADAADPAVAGAAHRRLPSRHPGAQRRRHAAAAADPAPDLADVQPQLGHRRSARAPPDPRSAARPACPTAALDAMYVAAYAARQGMDTAAFLEASGPTLTAGQAGKAIIDLTGPGYDQDAYLLTATGLSPVT